MKNNYNNIDFINKKINKQFDINIYNQLTDENLMDEYLKCKSVNNSIEKLINILKDVKIEDKIINEIKNKYILELIPPGTKSVIRGNKFNEIVKNYINNLKLDNNIYEIKFETHCNDIITAEKPDWYIKNIKTNKVIIGMNQMDLWNGGHQMNRGDKYLINSNINTNKSKLLCVICNKIQFKNNLNKKFNFFKIGFKNNTLCYLSNLDKIIKKFL